MTELIDILHRGAYSCVIRNGSATCTFHQRGVADLWQLCQDGEHFLEGAQIADKVVGKGAAALIIYGGIGEVYADVISAPALSLLQGHGIKVSYRDLADRILNRRGDGLCPVESLCLALDSIEMMVNEIRNFINRHA